MNYTIAIGADHRGFALKQFLIEHQFNTYMITWHDVGTFSAERTDYPPYAHAVCNMILSKQADFGVLLCGDGVGVTIAANRFKYIYCGLAWNADVARHAREDDNINVLALPADYLTPSQTLELLNAWLTASFKGGVYQRRIQEIDELP
ncbi:MAG: RpiB/LacA/LacB family sugar-phosphate isomerase [Candidatus Babeliaceae bacterium]